MLKAGVRIDDDVDIPLVMYKNKSCDLDISYNQVFSLLFVALGLSSYLHSLLANYIVQLIYHSLVQVSFFQ
jgi:hypothetical protein